MTEPEDAKPKIPAPPSLSQSLVKRVLGFGVWVAVGLAPFLGALRFPGFSALLELYPPPLQPVLLPLSGFLMGVIALVVENAGSGRLARKSLDRRFRGALITLAVSFVLLVVLYLFLVVKVQHQVRLLPAPPETRAFVTGALTVPAQPAGSPCTCPKGQDAAVCIKNVSLEEGNVRTCFGALQVTLASLALTFLYLTLTGSFAAAVGVFVLRQKLEKDRRRSRH